MPFSYAASLATVGLGPLATAALYLGASYLDALILGELFAPSLSDNNLSSQNLVVRASAEPHKIVYGRQMVGGTVVFLDVLDRYYLTGGSACDYGVPPILEQKVNGHYLNMAIAVAAHQIDEVEEIYIGEDLAFAINKDTGVLELVNNKYLDRVVVEVFKGEPGQQYSEFIYANVMKHYYGKNVSDYINTIYYSPNGVTNIDTTTNSITIDNTKVVNHSLLTYDYKNWCSDPNGNGWISVASGTYASGTYTFVPTTDIGRTLPAKGLPWSSSHKLTNTAYLYFRFKYDPEVFKSGVPKVRAVIRGKKLFDPRKVEPTTGYLSKGLWAPSTIYNPNDKVQLTIGGIWYRCTTTHTSTTLTGDAGFKEDFIVNQYWEQIHVDTDSRTWEWSNNWALVVRDYLTSGNYYKRKAVNPSDPSNSKYGIAVKDNTISDTNIIEAANISDEVVSLNNPAVTINTVTYSSTNKEYIIELSGDQTDYFAKYEKVSVNGGNNTYTVYVKLPYLVFTVTQLALDPTITLENLYISESNYNSTTDTTTIKIPVQKDIFYGVINSLDIYSPRFTADGVVNTGDSPLSVLESLLAAGMGSMPFAQGKFLVIPGVYQTPNITIDESILAGPVQVKGSQGVSELVNTVTGTLKSAQHNFEEVNFPKQTHSNFIVEDGGYELATNVKYAFTTSIFDAQRLARISLLRSRLQISAVLTCNLAALEIPVGAFIRVNIAQLGWNNKVFSVTNWTLQNNKVQLTIREEDPTVYVWDSTTLVPKPVAPRTTIDTKPDIGTISNYSITSGTSTLLRTGDGSIIPRVLLTWNYSTTNPSINTKLVLRISINSRDIIVELPDPSLGEYYIEGVKEGDLVHVLANVVLDNPNVTLFDPPDYTSVTADFGLHTVVGKSEVPTDVTNFRSSITEDLIVLSWDKNTELDFDYYEIRTGGVDWNTSTYLDSTVSNEYIVTNIQAGTNIFFIKAVDTSGNYSLNSNSTSVSVNLPGTITSINSKVVKDKINIYWNTPTTGTFPIASYEVREGGVDWSSSTHLVVINSTDYTIPHTWVGSKVIRVKAVDIYGNYSAETTTTISINTPNAPTLSTATFADERVEFSWGYTNYTGTFPVERYEVKYDSGTGTVDTANLLITTSTDAFSRRVDWGNLRRFWVVPIDIVGNYGTPSSIEVIINNPNAPSITNQVIDNNVLLRWTDARNTLPISHYEVRKGTSGSTYSTAEIVGNITGLFTTIFETISDTYTYWVTAVDTAGNYGASAITTVLVNEPPDYVLLTDYKDDFSGSKTNAIINSVGNLVMPVDTTETWAGHYINNTWNTPQDQINAGFPLYIQPTPANAQYQFIYDYGGTINNMSVTCNISTPYVVAGNPTLTLTMETSPDNINWTAYPVDSYKIFATSFRYVRVTLDVVSSAANTDVIEISEISLRLDIKERTDAGTGFANATDTFIKLSGGTAIGIFTSNETITQATTGATGTFINYRNNEVLVKVVSGTFNSTDSISGSTSGASYTPTSSTVVGGTIVTFNKPFTDINSINVTAKSSSSIVPIYDFVDIANPTEFFVYLFDSTTGNRVSGGFSWIIRGY